MKFQIQSIFVWALHLMCDEEKSVRGAVVQMNYDSSGFRCNRAALCSDRSKRDEENKNELVVKNRVVTKYRWL